MTIAPIAALGTAWIVTLVILAILIIAYVIVGVWGNKQLEEISRCPAAASGRAQPIEITGY